MRFDGRVVLVTGAGRGIGRATALLFAAHGARVAVADYSEEYARETARLIQGAGGEARAFQVDVSRADEVRQLMAAIMGHWGRLDVLVNNAGIYMQGDVAATSEEDWDRVMAVNLKGPFLCAREACPAMGKGGGGVIVNVGSEAGLVGIRGQAAYNVSKSGVIALTRSMAVDCAPSIRVNCICPGTTATPLVEEAVQRAADPVAARRALEQARPLQRLGKPEEIAMGILFLACDQAAYATGAVFSVDGGYTAQ